MEPVLRFSTANIWHDASKDERARSDAPATLRVIWTATKLLRVMVWKNN